MKQMARRLMGYAFLAIIMPYAWARPIVSEFDANTLYRNDDRSTDKPYIAEIISRDATDASDTDAWNRPENEIMLLPSFTLEQPAEPLHTSKVDFKEPVLYSLSLMAAGFGGFVAGRFKNGPNLDNFIESYKSPPRLDHDPPLFNFVFHPLWGSETYLRAREANFGIYGSIAFSLGASITWEYLFESWVLHPSTQDLILTTGIGWMIGEGRYYLKNKLGPKNYWWIDPIYTTLGYLNIGVNRDREGDTQTSLHLSWKF